MGRPGRRRHLAAIVSLPGMAAIALPALIVWRTGIHVGWGLPLPAAAAVTLLGVLLLASGLRLWTSTVRLFDTVGEGTLAPWDPPEHLVVEGVYRKVRNPMITTVASALLGEALALGSPHLLAWFLLFAAVNAVYIPRVEEPALRSRFGLAYTEYCRNVPRWLPRPIPWDAEAPPKGWYDLMAELGVPHFHFGGVRATERLLSLCGATAGREVLYVGSGSGYSACHAARMGCRVVGLDLSAAMVAEGTERARTMGLEDRVRFQVGDALALPFEEGTFDAVVTEFVTQFLDRPAALREYARVLRPGGRVGVNELARAEEVPPIVAARLDEAEAAFREVAGLVLRPSPPSEWTAHFAGAGLHDVQCEWVEGTYRPGEVVAAMGGPTAVARAFLRGVAWFASDPGVRHRMMRMRLVKEVLLRDPRTRPYVGSVLCVGRRE